MNKEGNLEELRAIFNFIMPFAGNEELRLRSLHSNNPGVVVRCGYCGNLWCFHPRTVRHPITCHCGNDNCGDPRKWEEHEFGDFDYLWSYNWDFKGGLR